MLSTASSFPSSRYFKPLCHSLNLLYLLFSEDENVNNTALNCKAPLLPNNLSPLVLSCPSCLWLFLLPPCWSQSSQSLSPLVKPSLLYSFHYCLILASSFCWYTCLSLFHMKMLTSLSLQSTFTKYQHVFPHHSQSIQREFYIRWHYVLHFSQLFHTKIIKRWKLQ